MHRISGVWDQNDSLLQSLQSFLSLFCSVKHHIPYSANFYSEKNNKWNLNLFEKDFGLEHGLDDEQLQYNQQIGSKIHIFCWITFIFTHCLHPIFIILFHIFFEAHHFALVVTYVATDRLDTTTHHCMQNLNFNSCHTPRKSTCTQSAGRGDRLRSEKR